MQTNKILSLLGMARRAGALAAGHDAAVNAVCSGRARLIVLCCDLSERSKRDMRIVAGRHEPKPPVEEIPVTMAQLEASCGIRAGILAVQNQDMATGLLSLIQS